MTRTLHKKGTRFRRCPICGKKGAYALFDYEYPVTVTVRCRYCWNSIYLRGQDYYGLDSAVEALARSYGKEASP